MTRGRKSPQIMQKPNGHNIFLVKKTICNVPSCFLPHRAIASVSLLQWSLTYVQVSIVYYTDLASVKSEHSRCYESLLLCSLHDLLTPLLMCNRMSYIYIYMYKYICTYICTNAYMHWHIAG